VVAVAVAKVLMEKTEHLAAAVVVDLQLTPLVLAEVLEVLVNLLQYLVLVVLVEHLVVLLALTVETHQAQAEVVADTTMNMVAVHLEMVVLD
jgi:hypothetical protein